MTEAEKEELRSVIRDTMQAELGSYKVPKEQHYKDHLFLSEFRDWIEGIKSSFWKNIIASMVTAFLILILLGFILFGKLNFK